MVVRLLGVPALAREAIFRGRGLPSVILAAAVNAVL